MPSTASIAEQGTNRNVVRKVAVVGRTPIMFDRYPGDNDTKLEAWQKLYLAQDGRTLVFPSLNIMSFLSAKNTTSAPKRLLDKRKYKATADACLSFVSISPDAIPFMRDGKPVVYGKFENDLDKLSGLFIHRCVARLEGGIPNPPRFDQFSLFRGHCRSR